MATPLSPLESRLERFLDAEERAEPRRRAEIEAYKKLADQTTNHVLEEVQALKGTVEGMVDSLRQELKGVHARLERLERDGASPKRSYSPAPSSLFPMDPDRTSPGGAIRLSDVQAAQIRQQLADQAELIAALQKANEEHAKQEAVAKAREEAKAELLDKQEKQIEKGRSRLTWWIPIVAIACTLLTTFSTWWVTVHSH